MLPSYDKQLYFFICESSFPILAPKYHLLRLNTNTTQLVREERAGDGVRESDDWMRERERAEWMSELSERERESWVNEQGCCMRDAAAFKRRAGQRTSHPVSW
jgi:hypothetical protein